MRKMSSPICEVDEFEQFRLFMTMLRDNYRQSLDVLMANLSSEESDMLKSILYVRKTRLGNLKTDYRRIYSIIKDN